MAKIVEVDIGRKATKRDINFMFNCPGCEEVHGFGIGWSFNKDFEKPTVSPSILVQWTESSGTNAKKFICHPFIKEGKIQFLNDCTHHLKGQTVELPECEL